MVGIHVVKNPIVDRSEGSDMSDVFQTAARNSGWTRLGRGSVEAGVTMDPVGTTRGGRGREP
jgi:hypothetical protein